MNITTFRQLYYACKEENKAIYEIALDYEASQGEYSEYHVRLQAKKSLDAMKDAIKTGLKSTEPSPSGMSGDDCAKLQQSSSKSILGATPQKIMTYALATSEQNLRMGRIVACPTAGSCGIVPAVLIAYAEDNGISENEQINALITAGEVGRLVANKMALAGAVGGCQAECGVASAMATSALTQMRGGSVKQILNAVALALKNILGLTCDPVCGLVEIPCVKRNPFLAIHAVTASELAMAGIISKIPLDEVVDAMEQTGQLMSPLLKESSQAGLAKTKTAIALEKNILK
jgi:L-serine dehydratase